MNSTTKLIYSKFPCKGWNLLKPSNLIETIQKNSAVQKEMIHSQQNNSKASTYESIYKEIDSIYLGINIINNKICKLLISTIGNSLKKELLQPLGSSKKQAHIFRAIKDCRNRSKWSARLINVSGCGPLC